MSRSSYTASERRGVLAIALISLILIGIGMGAAFIGDGKAEAEEIPAVIECSQFVDSVAKKEAQKNPDKKASARKKKNSNKKEKAKKVYRRRNPLDEPV